MTDGRIRTASEIAEARARDVEARDASPDATTADAASVQALVDATELEALRAKANERDAFNDKYLRALAEFDNYQKRARREQERFREDALRDVLAEMLLVLDNLDLALGTVEGKTAGAGPDLATFAKGVGVVRDQLVRLLANRGVTPLDVARGHAFDPAIHEAVSAVVVPGVTREEVGAVARRGFKLGSTLLRPAQVLVHRPAAAAAQPPAS